MTKFAAIELSRLARGAPDPTEAPQAALPRPHAPFVRRDYAVVNPRGRVIRTQLTPAAAEIIARQLTLEDPAHKFQAVPLGGRYKWRAHSYQRKPADNETTLRRLRKILTRTGI